MEDQTRFDLTVALETWRQELLAQTTLTAEDRHELEAHFVDSIAELRKHGLADEECFWLARRRFGPADKVGEQFLVADAGKVWRERTFWLAFGLFAAQWLGLVCKVALRAVVLSFPEWLAVYAPSWWTPFWRQGGPFWRQGGSDVLFFLVTWVFPFVIVMLVMWRGSLFIDPVLRYFIHSRWRFVTVSTATVLFVEWLGWFPYHGMQYFLNYFWWDSGLRILGLLALVAWLIPKQNLQQRHMTLDA